MVGLRLDVQVNEQRFAQMTFTLDFPNFEDQSAANYWIEIEAITMRLGLKVDRVRFRLRRFGLIRAAYRTGVPSKGPQNAEPTRVELP